MEKRKNLFCAWVNGNVEDINRSVLREEFSKFGNISKIFVAADSTFAKVYFDDPENLKQACSQLNGSKGWNIKFSKDDYKKHDLDNDFSSNSSAPRSRTSINQSFGENCNSNVDDMEEDCTFAGDYVDVHGKSVEVLEAENGELYVNLNDVRTAGFNIYKIESFQNATITKDVDLRHFENFLLNQGRKYILDMKKTFNEDEMLGVFERVKAKLQNKTAGEFGEGRVVNTSPNSRNFTITKNIGATISTGSNNRSSEELPGNFQPSFSYMKQKPKNDFRRFDERQDRQNGPGPRFNDRLNGPASRFDGRQNRQNDFSGTRRSLNNVENRNERNDDNRRKSHEPNQSFPNFNPNSTRKPRHSDEMLKNIASKALASTNANEEPEESWEGDKTSVPKSKSPSDTSSHTSERKSLNVERTVLTPNNLYKVKVSYVKPDKKSLLYGQWLDNINQIEEILLQINTVGNQLPEITEPSRNMLCIAYFERIWYRAIVLNGRFSGGAFVELIDYGNKELILTPLREMPEEMKKIPGMAIRIAIHQTSETDNFDLNIDEELEVFVKRHYEDLTHLVEVKRILPKLNEDPPTPPSEVSSDIETPENSKAAVKPTESANEECLMQVPPSTAKLTNGESVMIVGYTENKLILRNKETAKSCKDIYGHLLEMEKKPITNPKVGQLVLCSRDGMEGLHRAVIKKISNQVAELEYVDYYGGETLTLKSLRNVDKQLNSYPSAKIESPVVEWLKTITDESELLLNNLIMNKTKVKVSLSASKFDLLLVEGDKTISLSDKIKLLERPEELVPVAKPNKEEEVLPPKREDPAVSSTVKTEPDAEKFIKIPYDEMPYVTADLGLGNYICYSCKGDSLAALPAVKAQEYITQIEVPEPADVVPYQPGECEMCLAKFEGSWCRAIVTGSEDKNYEVLFVDFGNTEIVPKSDIRKFPKELAKIPILAVNTYFIGIPDDPKVHARLKELIPDETLLEVNVKTDLNEDLKYGIEIPSIYATLKQEKLI